MQRLQVIYNSSVVLVKLNLNQSGKKYGSLDISICVCSMGYAAV